jgi:hypothetical protein
MLTTTDWHDGYANEIAHAQSARALGNDGMARVCARRAAGIVIGEYLRRQDHTPLGPSAYQRLKLVETLPGLDPEIKHIVSHFILSVDKHHQLPVQVDLVSEAQWLAQQLLGVD